MKIRILDYSSECRSVEYRIEACADDETDGDPTRAIGLPIVEVIVEVDEASYDRWSAATIAFNNVQIELARLFDARHQEIRLARLARAEASLSNRVQRVVDIVVDGSPADRRLGG